MKTGLPSTQAPSAELGLTAGQLADFNALGISVRTLVETCQLAPTLDLSKLLISLKKINGGERNIFFPKAHWQLVLFNGDIEVLEQLSSQPEWGTLRGSSGVTPCHYAARLGSRDCLAWLFRQLGGKYAELLKQRDDFGGTVMHYAVLTDNHDYLTWLIEQLENETAECLLLLKDSDGRTPLHWVADLEKPTTFNYLVSQFPETAAYFIIKPSVQDNNGWCELGKPTRKRCVLSAFQKPLDALLTQISCELMTAGPNHRSIQVLELFAEEWCTLMVEKTKQNSFLERMEQSQDKLTAFKNYSLLLQTSQLKPENTEQLREHLNTLEAPQACEDTGGPSNAPAVVKIASVAEVIDEKADASSEEIPEVQASQEKRIEELEQIIAELKRNQEKLESSLNASQTETSSIQLDDAKKQVILGELATSKKQLEGLRKGEANFIEIVGQLTTQITKLQAEKEQLKSSSQESAEKDKQIAELEYEIKRLESKLHSKKMKLEKLQKEHRKLEMEHVKLTQLYESHQAAFNEASTARQAFEKAEDNMRKRRDEYVKAVKRANALEDTLRTTSSILQAPSLKAVQSNQQELLGGNTMNEKKEVAWEEVLRDVLDKLIEASNEGIAESKQVIKKSGDDALAVKKFSFLTRASDLPGAKEKDGKLYVFAPEVSSAESLSAGAPILYKQSTSRIPAGSEFELSVAEERAEEVQRHLSTATTVQGGVSLSVFDVGLELGTSQEQVQSSAATRTASNTQAQTIKPKLNLPPEGGDIKVNWYYVPKLRETTYQITVKGSVIVTFANKHKVEFDGTTGRFIVTDKKLGKLEKNEKVISIEQLMQKTALPEGLSEFVSDLTSQPGQVSYQRMTKVVEFYERRLEMASDDNGEVIASVAVDAQSPRNGADNVSTSAQLALPPLNVSRVGTQVTEEVLNRMGEEQLITFIQNYRSNSESSWQERAEAMFKLAERYEAKIDSGNLTPRREKLYRERARIAYEKAEQIIQGVRPNVDFSAWLSHRRENPNDNFGAASFGMTGLLFGGDRNAADHVEEQGGPSSQDPQLGR